MFNFTEHNKRKNKDRNFKYQKLKIININLPFFIYLYNFYLFLLYNTSRNMEECDMNMEEQCRRAQMLA
jgi:hypothetical protein